MNDGSFLVRLEWLNSFSASTVFTIAIDELTLPSPQLMTGLELKINY